MNESLKAAIDFANENKVCFLATVDGDQPTVRALAFWYANEDGFWFVTGTYQQFYQHLVRNPKTEVCFLHQEGRVSNMLRVRGQVELCNDFHIKERAMEDRPFLKNMGLSAESPELVIFRIAHGQFTFWSNQKKDGSNEAIIF